MNWISLGFVLFAVASSMLAAPAAHACKCAPAAVERSLPEGDAQGVPLDIAPLIFVGGDASQSEVAWATVTGEPVGFELRKGSNGPPCSDVIELIPGQPLQPNTQYTIAVSGRHGTEVLRFTTGEQRVSEQSAAPSVRLNVIVVEGRRHSCMSGDLGCLRIGSTMTEVLIPGKSREQFWVMTDRSRGIDVPLATECLEFRSRNLAGQRSEPLVLCGDKLNRRVLPDSERKVGSILCEQPGVEELADDVTSDGEDGRAEVVEDGCAAKAPPRSQRYHGSLVTFAFATLALALRRNGHTKRSRNSLALRDRL